MAKLGSNKCPAIARVQSLERAEQIISICDEHGWKVTVGIEPYQNEDISDIERLLNPPEPIRSIKVNRNAHCSCGSGKKYKKCCGQ